MATLRLRVLGVIVITIVAEFDGAPRLSTWWVPAGSDICRRAQVRVTKETIVTIAINCGAGWGDGVAAIDGHGQIGCEIRGTAFTHASSAAGVRKSLASAGEPDLGVS